MEKDEVMNYNDPPNDIKDQLVNAGIEAGLAFFTSIAGMGAVGLIKDPILTVIASGIAGGLAFFISLATQRGLRALANKNEK